MICYRDMTFCSYYKDCVDAEDCSRPLTPEVLEQAEKWMKNPPIAMFSEKPECHKTIGDLIDEAQYKMEDR